MIITWKRYMNFESSHGDGKQKFGHPPLLYEIIIQL